MTIPAPHEVADVAELSAVVHRVLGTTEAQVVTWEHQVLYGGGGALSGRSGVHRFAGSARAGDRTLPWSAVLKVIGAPSGNAVATTGVGDPRHADYWKREARAFELGLLDALPAGLAAPRCFGVAERPEGMRIWMEEVSDTIGAPWPLRRFGVAARHLGRFNGAYLAGRPVPEYPWLGQGLLRARADRNARFWATVDTVRSAPLFRRGWPADLADRAQRLFQERHTFLDLLDRLPQTLRHGDADRRNLLARDGPAATSGPSPSTGPTWAPGPWARRSRPWWSPACCGARASRRGTCRTWRPPPSTGTWPGCVTPDGWATLAWPGWDARRRWPCATAPARRRPGRQCHARAAGHRRAHARGAVGGLL